MSAANGNEGVPPPPKGVPKGEKDDTIVKVTGLAIGGVVITGIAYGVYRGFFAEKKKEEPLGFDHPKGDAFHEQISVSKPEGLSKLEAGAKDKAGQVEGWFKDSKESTKEKATEAKDAVAGKTKETKESAYETGEKLKEEAYEEKESAFETAGKKKEDSGNWFSNLFGKGKEKKNELAYEAEKTKEGAKKNLEEGKEKAYDAKRSTEKKEKSFFDKAGAELDKDARELDKDARKVTKALIGAEKKVEEAFVGAEKKVEKAVFGAEKKLTSPKDKPKHKHHHGYKEYVIRRGDTVWGISRRYGVTIEDIKKANGIWNADYIVAGDTLDIPK